MSDEEDKKKATSTPEEKDAYRKTETPEGVVVDIPSFEWLLQRLQQESPPPPKEISKVDPSKRDEPNRVEQIQEGNSGTKPQAAIEEEEIPKDSEGARYDPKVQEAEIVLRDFFNKHADETFYERQLTVGFEDNFFHWITAKALRRLTALGALATSLELVPGAVGRMAIRFYRHPRHRYWKRQAKEIGALVAEFSRRPFLEAIGLHGEAMFDAALPKAGFLPRAHDVREFGGKKWTHTEHDLDRVYERDGIFYGLEIKNTLPYIPREELTIKLEMCKTLGLRPLFIARMHPKSYIEEIRQQGGYGMPFKHQLYPFGYGAFAKRVRDGLGLPVDCPRAIADGTIQRFLNWHLKTLGKATG